MYRPGLTVVKTGTPLIIPVVVAGIESALDAAGVSVSDGVVLWIVSATYGIVVGFKNWLKNRKK